MIIVDMSLADRLLSFENGELDEEQIIGLFADLVKVGWAWQLQGWYGRTAHDLIEAGVITADGKIGGGIL